MSYKNNVKLLAVLLVVAVFFITACTAKNSDSKTPEESSLPEIKEPIVSEENESKSSDENYPKGNQNGSESEEKDPIAEQMDKMTLEEKIGQLIVVGLDGYSMDDNAREMIDKYNVGGFILYKKNIENVEQLVNLINSLKAVNSGNEIPLFISVDEEGGQITRLPGEIKKLPASGKLGEIGDEKLSFEIGRLLGYELNAFGFNMNFAPVLDINSNPQNPVIGERAFGSDEEVVSRLGIQTMKGIQSEGVISVVKHFPGHGDTSVDSHVGLPRVDHGLDRLKEFELIPFAHAIENGADAVMVAHILFPQIDSDNPATLSKTIITDILKKDMGFEGVVVTDDMTMGAIVENYAIGEAVVKSILAGSDIVLVCHGYENGIQAITAVRDAVKEGLISEDRIDESVYKVLKLKKKYNLNDEPVELPNIEELNKKIDDTLKMAS